MYASLLCIQCVLGIGVVLSYGCAWQHRYSRRRPGARACWCGLEPRSYPLLFAAWLLSAVCATASYLYLFYVFIFELDRSKSGAAGMLSVSSATYLLANMLRTPLTLHVANPSPVYAILVCNGACSVCFAVVAFDIGPVLPQVAATALVVHHVFVDLFCWGLTLMFERGRENAVAKVSKLLQENILNDNEYMANLEASEG